jgi:hypothetical protein
LSLEDYDMNRYDLPELQRLYFSQSQYSPPPSPADSLMQWPGTYPTLAREKPILDETLARVSDQPYTLADQVFGRQVRHARLGLKRLLQLLYERCGLHYRHMKEINHEDIKCQEQLFINKINSPMDGGRRQSNLEKLLIQIESDKRREELQFWKDTFEVRQLIFEKAMEYALAKDRASMLGSVEGSNG